MVPLCTQSFKRILSKHTGKGHRQHTDTECILHIVQVMGLKYDREWEPVYQAFLLRPLVQMVQANPAIN